MLCIRVAAEELDMLARLVQATGLKQSDVVRQLIRKAHAELEPQPKPAKRNKR